MTFSKKILLASAFLIFRIFTANANTDDGLVAYWPMDEGSGNIINDKSGNGNTGNIHGKIKWVDGKDGKKALLFDGTTTYIDCGNSKSLNTPDKITIEAWVKLNARQGGGIVHKYLPSSGYYLTAAWRDNQLPYFFVRDSASATFLREQSLSTGTWHHLLATAEQNGKMRLYIDGKLLQEKDLRHSFGNDTGHLFIGRYGDDYFSGLISDVKIYDRIIAKSDNPITQRLIEENKGKVLLLENSFTELKKRFEKLKTESLVLKQNFEDKINSLGDRIKKFKSEYADLTKYEFDDELETINSYLLQLPTILRAAKEGKLSSGKILVTAVKPVRNTPILPSDIFVPGDISGRIDIKGCPGEYESASFAVSPFTEISCLSIEASDLKSDDNTIPARNIDLKTVKCWFQAGPAWTDIAQDKNKRILVPDLLVNDDNLIRTNISQQDNYLKVTAPDGATRYVWISNPDEKCSSGHPTIEELPVKDSPYLLPLDIAKGYNKQFWITVKVPDNASPGNYKGLIRLKTPKEMLMEIEFTLTVLPFKLDPPCCTSSIYYSGKLDKKGNGSLSSELKNELQLRKDFENMAEHGISNPVCYQPYDELLLKKYLDIKRDSGLIMSPFYYLEMGIYGELVNFNPSEVSSLEERVKKIIGLGKAYGMSEFYFYAIDEAKGDRLASQRQAWELIHKAGGKVFVAGIKGANFKLIGDVQDLLICEGELSREEAANWHSAGHKIWSYSNPQSGVKNPEIYRKNFGIRLWQYDYDGACTFAYQCSMGNIWNDFDYIKYRDHCFAYPAVDGVINTIAWEGYREAVKDAKYLTTLLNLITVLKKTSGSDTASLIEAERFIKELKSSDVATADIDEVRDRIIGYILLLQKKQGQNNVQKK